MEPSTKTSNPVETDPKASWRFQKELPEDRTHLAQAWKLLEAYSGIEPGEVEPHVTAIRDKAFAIFHYPCIGRWRFLDFYLTAAPQYPEVVSRVKAGARLLDLGCCFGHMLRQLAFDGCPASNLTGADLRPEFVDLGYELFRDRDRFDAKFVTGDVLDRDDRALAALDGGFDIIHAASFFHLFSRDEQLVVGERLVRFFRPGADALLIGRQVGSYVPGTAEVGGGRGFRRFLHNVESLQALWDEIGGRTGTQWKASGDMFESNFDGVHRVILRFAIRKAS